jgi:hypothetical protein
VASEERTVGPSSEGLQRHWFQWCISWWVEGNVPLQPAYEWASGHRGENTSVIFHLLGAFQVCLSLCETKLGHWGEDMSPKCGTLAQPPPLLASPPVT